MAKVLNMAHLQFSHRILHVSRAHSFPWAAEFRAEPRNLPFAVDILSFPQN